MNHLGTSHPHDTVFNLLRRLNDRTFTGHSAISMVNGFVSGLGKVFMGLIPLAILWFVLTGTSVLGFDVVAIN